MRKTLETTFCALGSCMIGFFANQLETVPGVICFSLGIAMLTGSILSMTKKR